VRKHLREGLVPGPYILVAGQHQRLRDNGATQEVPEEIIAEMRANEGAVQEAMPVVISIYGNENDAAEAH
jgi:hypothetical protein